MAKPIKGNPTLKGKDAAQFLGYLKKAKLDPKKRKKHDAYLEAHSQVKVVK